MKRNYLKILVILIISFAVRYYGIYISIDYNNSFLLNVMSICNLMINVRPILNIPPINVIFDYNETPLVYSIRRDNYEAVKILLENGANPNAEYGWEGNFGLPLEYCLHHGRKNRYKIAELLLSYGASGFEDRNILIRLLAISRTEDNYETASYKNKLFLQWMNQYYKYDEEFNYEIVYWAIDGNAIEEFLYMMNNYTIDLNYKNDKSQYILIPAARNRNVELFDLLIGYGAEFGFIDKNGKSIEDYILDVKYDKKMIDSEYRIINYDNEKQEMLNILRDARENVVD